MRASLIQHNGDLRSAGNTDWIRFNGFLFFCGLYEVKGSEAEVCEGS